MTTHLSTMKKRPKKLIKTKERTWFEIGNPHALPDQGLIERKKVTEKKTHRNRYMKNLFRFRDAPNTKTLLAGGKVCFPMITCVYGVRALRATVASLARLKNQMKIKIGHSSLQTNNHNNRNKERKRRTTCKSRKSLSDKSRSTTKQPNLYLFTHPCLKEGRE